MVQMKRLLQEQAKCSPSKKTKVITVPSAKRHVKFSQTKSPLQRITSPVIRRLARRAGCKRLSQKINNDIRESLKVFLTKTLMDATCYAINSKRKTLNQDDIHFALRRQGRTLYM